MDLPTNYEEWLHCITVKCGIKLSKSFLESRLTVYLDCENLETKKFIELYGDEHLRCIVMWLTQANHKF